ncbi:MAG: hypothetical protein HY903_19395 [Deltaproteobacteria bacterium]|nr:hypothetical protein [Deltaproteobacteria bacterium]
MATPKRPTRTVRELGGEVFAALEDHPDLGVDWKARNAVVDLLMGVLARHDGARIVNDPDLPVTPLPVQRSKRS